MSSNAEPAGDLPVSDGIAGGETDRAGVAPADDSQGSGSTENLEPLRVGLRYGLAGLGILTAVALVIWGPWRGLPGLWGALIGAAVGGAFILITAVVILLSVNLGPSAAMATLMGSWLVKMVAVIVVIAVLRSQDFYDKAALATTLIGAIVLVLGAEVYGVLKTRVAYVDTVD